MTQVPAAVGKEVEMKKSIKNKLVAIPLLAASNLLFAAEPALFSTADMDRITAGSHPIFIRSAGPVASGALDTGKLVPGSVIRLPSGALAWISRLLHKSEWHTLHPLSADDAAALNQMVKSGPSVSIRQVNYSGGFNYAYVTSSR